MVKGPNRIVLDRYLDSAQEGTLKGSGRGWKQKAEALLILADALKVGAEQAELRIGEQTLTGPALRKGMEESSTSMAQKSEQLRTAGQALVDVGTQIGDTREARDLMKDLDEKPSPYSPPAGTPGAPPTKKELDAQVVASEARTGERTSWQDAFDKQEARSFTLTKQMDSAFIEAIPPMKAIHGQEDPTEPPPSAPASGGGPLLPGTTVPTSGGGGSSGDGGDGDKLRLWAQSEPKDPNDPKPPKDPNPTPKDPDPTPKDPVVITCNPGREPDPNLQNPDPKPEPGTIHRPATTTPTATTSVIGSSQSGVTYSPGSASVSAPVSAPSGAVGMSSGATAGAAGMAGAAGATSMGGVRGASASAAPGRSATAPVRAIGSTARSGSASALSRSATPGGASARPTTPGAGSGSRAGSPGSAAGRSGSAGRGGAAGARGAGSAGSRSGGSRGAAGRGAGSAAGGRGGRGGRKGDRDQTTDRDNLVYDQDWLGDDEVAPGVLD